jgi:hypothetical protein
MIMAKEEETCKQQESSHTVSHPQNFQKKPKCTTSKQHSSCRKQVEEMFDTPKFAP